jgi:hypothetical protein
MQAQACFNQQRPALPPIWLPLLPLLAGGIGIAGFAGGAAYSAAGAGGGTGTAAAAWGLDGVGVGVVRGYWHGTTGGSGTAAVFVTNLQDKCLAAGRPPAPDFLRILS